MHLMRLAAVVAAVLTAPVSAQTTFNFTFDASPDNTVTAPLVGSGSFTTSDTLDAGDYQLTSLTDYNFAFVFGAATFSNADIQTPVGDVILRVSGVGSNLFLNFGGGETGPFNGSLDFRNSNADALSFQPGFGSLYFQGMAMGTYEATTGGAGAVPEPASWLMLITGFGLVGAIARRRPAPQRA